MVPFNGSGPLDYGADQIAVVAILLFLIGLAILLSGLVGR